MPSIKPLKKLVTRARDLRDSHTERHRPTGLGFALADSVDYLDAQRWDAVTAHDSLFLSRRYLRILEETGPKNLRQRYALIFRGRDAVAAVAAQAVNVSLARIRKTSRQDRISARSNAWKKKCSCAATSSHGVCTESPSRLMKTGTRSGLRSLRHSIACDELTSFLGIQPSSWLRTSRTSTPTGPQH